MSDGLARFNGLPSKEAVRQLYGCFAAWSWAEQVAAGRPYAAASDLFNACESAWTELAPVDWRSAFAAHPRIGESGGHSPESSEREQSGVRAARAQTMAALAEENRRYEARFGHVFLIFASGRSADDVLAAIRQRMGNTPQEEVLVAAAEHRKITRLRLERMLSE